MQEAGEKDTVLFLLSGGGSALLELPEEGLALPDIQEVTGQLLRCGADITEINLIRKKLSAVKGGKLAGFLKTKKAYSIILSDVVGGSEDMIASGLTYPDEAYSPGTHGKMTANFWYPVMKNGVITFLRPEDCPLHKPLREMEMKIFDRELGNFSGLAEFEGVI